MARRHDSPYGLLFIREAPASGDDPPERTAYIAGLAGFTILTPEADRPLCHLDRLRICEPNWQQFRHQYNCVFTSPPLHIYEGMTRIHTLRHVAIEYRVAEVVWERGPNDTRVTTLDLVVSCWPDITPQDTFA